VNLIGEHTDYNDGYVLPMALPFETVMSVSARSDDSVCLVSTGYGETRFELDSDPESLPAWARYVAGMAWMLIEGGLPACGFDATISTTIPVGASLSSSAALEVATGFALTALAGLTPDPVAIAKLGQRVENEVIGIQSGIMDQLISAVAVAGGPTLIDCRSLHTTPTTLPADAQVVIMDTMTRRELAESEYDARRQSCERAAAALGVASLRDVTIHDLDRLEVGVDRRRAEHVVTENERVLQAVESLDRADAASFGQLMSQSHESLSVGYEVSSEALDQMVDAASGHAACFGARMTGGGFAGCAVALVERSQVDSFLAHVRSTYAAASGITPDLWAVDPASGASVEPAVAATPT
jgi:galactokinase